MVRESGVAAENRGLSGKNQVTISTRQALQLEGQKPWLNSVPTAARSFPAPFADVAVIALNQQVRRHKLRLHSPWQPRLHSRWLLRSRRSHNSPLRDRQLSLLHQRSLRSRQNL